MAPRGASAKSTRTIAGPEDFAREFAVSRETTVHLETYAALLARWQPAVNLVAAGTLGEVWSRHFADSAQLWRFAPNARTWLDLGSGAGFPGLVVAILGQGQGLEKITLIESDQRKCAFMRDVVRRTGLANTVDIIAERIETVANASNRVAEVDIISSRALAPMVKLLQLAQLFFGVRTLGIFPKGRDIAAEITDARAKWAFDLELVQSSTAVDARIALVRNLSRKPED